MPQFSWGNMKSLKEIPEATKVDPLKKLREFYEKVRVPCMDVTVGFAILRLM